MHDFSSCVTPPMIFGPVLAWGSLLLPWRVLLTQSYVLGSVMWNSSACGPVKHVGNVTSESESAGLHSASTHSGKSKSRGRFCTRRLNVTLPISTTEALLAVVSRSGKRTLLHVVAALCFARHAPRAEQDLNRQTSPKFILMDSASPARGHFLYPQTRRLCLES